ncbi:uncharacterized protein B0H18DRAFT_970067, partial [Fomitopsis serialis]|uniref:uncharacterized protein n=1 Tax=Fomitopsis serialis TaxID=139415 RepID=UPI002007268E
EASDWEVQKKLTAAGDVETAGAFKVTKEITNTFDGVKAKAGGKKKATGKQNVPPVDDLSWLPPLPPSPPPSPGKRRQTDSHYNGHCSPSKKRDARADPACSSGHDQPQRRDGVDEFDLGETKPKPRMVAEVVLEARPKPRRDVGRPTRLR